MNPDRASRSGWSTPSYRIPLVTPPLLSKTATMFCGAI